MSKKRIKISAVYNEFLTKFNALKRFDSKNQINFDSGKLSRKQNYLLTESIFFNLYRDYENFIRDVFLLYTLEKENSNSDTVISYLKPKDFFHAEQLIKSSMNFLDWNSPDMVINRAELYLKNGFPVKNVYTVNRVKLREFKKIRNHIAHNSLESLETYKKVLKSHFGTIPLSIPSPGEFLLETSKTDPLKYLLLEVFDVFGGMANQLK